MDFRPYHKDLKTLHLGTEKSRSYFIPYSTEDGANEGNRYNSDFLTLLNGEWNFRFYNTFEDISEDFLFLPFNETIDVPKCWQVYTDRNYDVPLYSNLKYPFPLDPPHVPVDNPCGLYNRNINIKVNPSKKYYLLFEGVSSCFYLFVNDKFVAYSQVSHSTSEIDVSDYLVNGDNKIDILVVKWCDGSYLEDQDMFRLSGIFRDVYVLERDEKHLKDIYIKQEVSDNLEFACITAEIEGVENYKYKLVDPNGKIVFEGNNLSSGVKIMNPVLWNAENPQLYTLIFSCENEYIPFKLAIRKLEIKGNIAYFNNKPIKLYGINRHDSNHETGYYCDIDHMTRDLMILKQGNVNTIRTSHYPSSPLFMELCDKYGFMVCDEADIETHGMGFEYKDTWDWPRWSFLSRSDDWEEAYVDRAKLLFERDKNFGCVIMWSLGNESGCGKNHRAMRNFLKSRDPECIVHYENAHLEFKSVPIGENYSDISDVESRMYAPLDYTEEYGKSKDAKKPFFFCEFSCSSSTGDIEAHCDVFRKYDNIFGGCYWELTDHAVSVGEGKYRYGGDFGDYPNDDICCVDGVVFPDRSLRPGFYDMKKGYEPFEFSYCDGKIKLFNRKYFTHLKDVYIEAVLEENGKVIHSQIIENVDVPERSSAEFVLNADIKPSACLWLALSVKQSNDTPWAEKGFEIGFNQFNLSTEKEKLPEHTGFAPSYLENRRFIEIYSGDTTYVFDKPYGVICQVIKDGEILLDKPVVPEIWKAPGNNEVGRAIQCRSASMHCACLRAYDFKLKRTDKIISITCNCSVGGPMVVPVLKGTITYTFFGDGNCEIRFKGDLRNLLKEMDLRLPRFGFKFTLPEGFENMSYLGYGPIETYCERFRSQKFSEFNTTVDDNFVPYVKPFENGSHFGCKYGIIDNGIYGFKFLPSEDSSFQFNASHFLPIDLDETLHNDELIKRKETFVYCDYKMDIRGGRGYYENIEPERIWDYKTINFAVTFKPIKK